MVTDVLHDANTFDCLASVAELVRAAQAGNREAQSALYERYHGSAIALAYRKLGNWDEAEELVQDVFIHAFERLDQLRVPEAFGGWLRQIVRRSSINAIMRRRPSINLESEAMEAASVSLATPLDEALDNECRQQVHFGLEKLGDIDRQTLEAFYISGRSLIEMAEDFSAPIGTIKRRLHVARKRLAREMEGFQAL